ncbi:hypothetical protein [Actinokineospora spheciospongiae]|uniref:hypothetical protein n=1 Tax=Actinokineospora spheciospongiae TaxID=909613 RepID=UPI000D71B8AB|nr:hypothetical protein [Actinokineospora spheciospongiae]PWW53111.1 hypothetical protein DFQ13_116101 [Actinokineospora spheciospongiae]
MLILVALFSVKGSPGVSTLALGLAVGWPATQRVLLVEARLPVSRPLVLPVGDGHSAERIAREMDIHPLGRVPDDSRDAAVLGGRHAPFDRRFGGTAATALGRAAHGIATVLAAHPWPPTSATTPAPAGCAEADLEPRSIRAC